ncbi:site-specific integrase [Herbaspirillum sp. C7C8]|uniref:site-specific integrase n=1 Tax=Herbaspirillum sp. C7C8 TaxID=2736665 RepID=UPI001F52032C|nr:site-specific integrase [Herbaspirillum sp. C7C8]MCI1004292.1 site-specific integrase [Herbaspirillum sp. C7C8]
MNDAYLEVIERHKQDRFNLPYAFSILDESPQSNGAVREVRHHFQLWDAATLRSLHEKKDPDFYRSGLTHQKTIGEMSAEYFLSYEGGHQEGEPNSKMSYWFVDVLKAKTLVEPDHERFRAEYGYSINQLTKNILSVPDWGMAVRWWHQKMYQDLGLVFLPIEALMRMALVGHGAIQTFTKSGARVNEFMQIRLTKENLYRISLPNDHEAIVFTAMPKGRKVEEPFYIDEHCLKALHDWWTYQRSQGYKFEEVKPDLTLRPKIRPASFLWQYAKRHLSHIDINASIKWLLHDVHLVDQDGKTIALTSHLFRHGFATELRSLGTPMDILALLLKQRDVEVTGYYSKPTPAQIISLQRKIFANRMDLSKLHRRAPAQIKQQVDDALEKIGALIPVVGGNCTVANECPAKFACIGCAGNAPDPKKRPQVIELKAAYGRMQKMAEDQKLPAERRKAIEIMASCDDVLAEMDLIESAAEAAEAPVEIYPERRKANGRTTKKQS